MSQNVVVCCTTQVVLHHMSQVVVCRTTQVVSCRMLQVLICRRSLYVVSRRMLQVVLRVTRHICECQKCECQNCEFSLFCQSFMTQLRIFSFLSVFYDTIANLFFLYFVSFGALPPMKGAPYHYGHGPPLIPRSCMVGGHPTKWHYHQFIHFL